MTLLISLLALGSSAAQAAPLQWDWEAGESHRYVLRNQVYVSDVFVVRDELNKDAQIMVWTTELNLHCKGGGPVGKRAFEATCNVEDVRLTAKPNDSRDAVNLPDILLKWRRLIKSSTIELVVRNNGPIRELDVSVPTELSTERSRLVEQSIQMLLERALAGFELPLPRKGEMSDEGWGNKPSRLLATPTLVGTMGNADVATRPLKTDGEVVTAETTLRGVRGPAEENNLGQIANLWAFEGTSQWTFDRAQGVLLALETRIDGELTPSSDLAAGGTPLTYIQRLQIEHHAADEKIEPFGPNEVLDAP